MADGTSVKAVTKLELLRAQEEFTDCYWPSFMVTLSGHHGKKKAVGLVSVLADRVHLSSLTVHHDC